MSERSIADKGGVLNDPGGVVLTGLPVVAGTDTSPGMKFFDDRSK